MDEAEILDNLVKTFAGDFIKYPYRWFTEADAVSEFRCRLLDKNNELGWNPIVHDGKEIELVHQEYPTPFSRESRAFGEYDITILKPEYIKSNDINSIAKPDPKTSKKQSIFHAVFEFKLCYKSFSPQRNEAVKKDFFKLTSSKDFADHRYLIYLQRYLLKSITNWQDNFHTKSGLYEMAFESFQKSHVKSIFAISWISAKRPAVQQELYPASNDNFTAFL
jgi:hypothetical protein